MESSSSSTSQVSTPGASQSDDVCSVCLAPKQNPSSAQPCAHTFCKDCLMRWLDAQPKAHCPLCRTQVNAVHHDLRSADDYQVTVVHPKESPDSDDDEDLMPAGIYFGITSSEDGLRLSVFAIPNDLPFPFGFTF